MQEVVSVQYTGFQKTIVYAISLGGDTDTIATMAGAIAGAHYGITGIPHDWMDVCEGIRHACLQADQLYDLVFRGDNQAAPPSSSSDKEHHQKTSPSHSLADSGQSSPPASERSDGAPWENQDGPVSHGKDEIPPTSGTSHGHVPSPSSSKDDPRGSQNSHSPIYQETHV